MINKDSLFYEYDLIKDEVNNSNLKVLFESLKEEQRIRIILRWFGLNPLFNDMIKSERGLKHLREAIINIKYQGDF